MSELYCEHLSFPSADGKNTVAAYLYTMPDVPVRAVLQLSHGMCEYIERYRDFAAFFAAHGIAVAGNDHLGHGNTAGPQDRGHYGKKGGRYDVLNDLYSMNALLHERFPNLPIFLYGHSMGSFYARWYAEVFPKTIHAAIWAGTAGPDASNRLGEGIAASIATVRGEHTVSPLMVWLNFGTYNRRILDATSSNAWLTRDAECVQRYDADELCRFSFTIGTYREMLHVLNHISTKQWAQSIPDTLPVLLIAGGADPVGNYGSGVHKVARMLRLAGVKDVTCRIWQDGRHELHNELNREEVLQFVLHWIEHRL